MKHAVNLFGGNITLKILFEDLVIPTPDITIFTDVTEIGWDITGGNNLSGGQWAEHERVNTIVLELKVAFIDIHTHCYNRTYKHVRVVSDSSIAIACINNKGGIKSKKRNKIAKETWLWYFKNNSFISAAHIPGKHNAEVDQFSRTFNDNTEWPLYCKIFIEIINTFGCLEIGLFVTRINFKIIFLGFVNLRLKQ